MYHRDERYAAKEREDREETRFARDRFSLPTGDEDDDDDDEAAAVATVRADGGRKSEKESSGERDTERANRGGGRGGGMPVKVVNRIPRNLCVIYGDLRRAV